MGYRSRKLIFLVSQPAGAADTEDADLKSGLTARTARQDPQSQLEETRENERKMRKMRDVVKKMRDVV
ncbi:MAG: hypothetical protein C4519_06805 [Desulfobacteraceae bacterium]|nr:MAG: hypothetical protein C4519_06805 [Desulfobacteraceae bacterium]